MKKLFSFIAIVALVFALAPAQAQAQGSAQWDFELTLQATGFAVELTRDVGPSNDGVIGTALSKPDTITAIKGDGGTEMGTIVCSGGEADAGLTITCTYTNLTANGYSITPTYRLWTTDDSDVNDAAELTVPASGGSTTLASLFANGECWLWFGYQIIIPVDQPVVVDPYTGSFAVSFAYTDF